MSESMNRKQAEDRQNAGRRLHLREVSSEFEDYDGIGADLRAGRVRLGQDIADLANKLRIRSEHLVAIEQGRFSDLPAPVYAVGFVRTYAEYVGLNGEDAIRRFKEEAEGLPAHSRLSFPTPEEESRVPKGWLLALAGIAAVLVYAGWYYAENKDRLNLAEVPAIPERLAEKAKAPVALQAPQPRLQVPAPPAAVAVSDEATVSSTTESREIVSSEETVAPVAANVAALEDTAQTTAVVAETTQDAQSETTTTVVQPEAAPETPSVTPGEPAQAEQSAQVVEPVSTEPTVVADPATSSAVPTDQDVQQPLHQDQVKVEETSDVASGTIATVTVEPVSTPTVSVVAEEVQTTVLAEPVTQPAQPEVQVVQPASPPVVETPVSAPETVVETRTEVAALADKPAEPTPVLEKTNIPPASAAAGRKKEAFGSAASESRVEVYARVDVWVQVTTPEGQPVLSRILRQGDSYFAPLDQQVFLTTGNAGALQILVDGKVIPPVGPPGAVRRDVSLNPDQLLSISPRNESSADN